MRLRNESPLYYNERYDFYALSRFEDVEKAVVNHATFSSARGGVLDTIQSGIDIPSGVFIWEDPPLHSAHRGLLSRVFTPKKMNALEPQIRSEDRELIPNAVDEVLRYEPPAVRTCRTVTRAIPRGQGRR